MESPVRQVNRRKKSQISEVLSSICSDRLGRLGQHRRGVARFRQRGGDPRTKSERPGVPIKAGPEARPQCQHTARYAPPSPQDSGKRAPRMIGVRLERNADRSIPPELYMVMIASHTVRGGSPMSAQGAESFSDLPVLSEAGAGPCPCTRGRAQIRDTAGQSPWPPPLWCPIP